MREDNFYTSVRINYTLSDLRDANEEYEWSMWFLFKHAQNSKYQEHGR